MGSPSFCTQRKSSKAKFKKIIMNTKSGILFIALFGLASANLPCYKHTVDACNEASIGNIVGNEPFASLSAADCQTICQLIYQPDCKSFIYDRVSGLCTLHDGILAGYLDTCLDASGPLNEAYDGCTANPNLDPSCYNYREQECTFTGTTVATVSAVDDAPTCELFCELQAVIGCQFFVFSAVENKCDMYSDLQESCTVSAGPSSPSYQLCNVI